MSRKQAMPNTYTLYMYNVSLLVYILFHQAIVISQQLFLVLELTNLDIMRIYKLRLIIHIPFSLFVNNTVSSSYWELIAVRRM